MENNKEHRLLGQILIEQKLISQKDLEEVLREQTKTGRFIGEILVRRGLASEEQIAKALSEQLGFAYVDLSQITIEPKAITLIPEETALRLNAMPLFIMQDTLTIAMVNPLDIKATDELRAVSGMSIRPVFACSTAIRAVIENQYHKPIIKTSLLAFESLPSSLESILLESDLTAEQVLTLKQVASLAPVVEMVNNIITHAVEMSASDIHLEPEKGRFICRYRVDGILYSISEIPFSSQAAVISRVKIMANMDIAEKRLPQDGRIRTFAAGRDVDLRISTFPTIHGENLVIRILDRSQGLLNLEQLGFLEENLKLFSELINRPYGIILVTGPTGSGKTTTLYAALTKINISEKNIITLEDPVEYEIPNIRQSQVNVKAGLTFASGLRSMVRQDPDVIMIGEIRDKETADIAIHAALTGHLVFSTLHTNDAPSACARLIDMGVEPFLIASSIIGILAQRLIRILCSNCKTPYLPSKELLLEIGLKKEEVKTYTFHKENGCSLCNQRGYIGRTGIFELLMPNDQIKELITRKVSATILREEARKSGMMTLREAGIEKVVSGVTSVSEVLRVTESV